MFFKIRKDGGPESNVTGYWLIEWKKGFSIALLRFSKGSREAFHSHAFGSVSWVIKGALLEQRMMPDKTTKWAAFTPSLTPIYVAKDNLHKVHGMADSTWALTFRGPWDDNWQEKFEDGREVTLGHGRVVLKEKVKRV